MLLTVILKILQGSSFCPPIIQNGRYRFDIRNHPHRTLITTMPPRQRQRHQPSILRGIIRDEFDEPLDYDDDDHDNDDLSPPPSSSTTPPPTKPIDYSGCSSRQFSLGYDIQLNSYIGTLGFEEITDWEYSNPEDGTVVDPPPFDPSQPKRTRERNISSSGDNTAGGTGIGTGTGIGGGGPVSVRIFRGELVGTLASKARSRGLDTRIIAKEFSGGTDAVRLAEAEVTALSAVQGKICRMIDDGGASKGEWGSSAARRYVMGRVYGTTKEDDENLLRWMEVVTGSSGTRRPASSPRTSPYTALFGELNLVEFLEDDNARNEWYRALSVPPPKPTSLWLIYEYTALPNTLGRYAVPALRRWSALPPKKTLWGGLQPPPSLPPFKERSKYVVKGILKGALQALATVHDAGYIHRSIGPDSILLSSIGQEKAEAYSPLATVIPRLVVKLADFGFAGKIKDSVKSEEFRRRAKSYGIQLSYIDATRTREECDIAEAYAVAEDLHAMGFVFVAVLLGSLADIPTPEYVIPPTDEDSLQRLLADIFDKDMGEFREYCEAEEVWEGVVELLDQDGGAGWDVLGSMCFARERLMDNFNKGKILTAKSLLSSSFFQ